jgi:hypothetical protein
VPLLELLDRDAWLFLRSFSSERLAHGFLN